MLKTTAPWWETDQFDRDIAIDPVFTMYAGPKGLAAVSVYEDGTTQKGWGLTSKKGPAFIENYDAGKFDIGVKVDRFEKKGSPFAIVMRSVPMLCVDIDGKNGGFDNVGSLGRLTPTLAETSKSGNGFHLFYMIPNEEWDEVEGFAGGLKDVLGLVPGVDIRVTGCVFHYPSQRWNSRPVGLVPDSLMEMLKVRAQRVGASQNRIAQVIAHGDDEDLLMEQTAMVEELKKPIPEGKRNTSLYALGRNLKDLGVGMWASLIEERALEVGLESDEIDKLVKNIQRS